jgi:hypothetical protein
MAQLEGGGEGGAGGGAGTGAGAGGVDPGEASDAAVALVTAQLSNTVGEAPREVGTAMAAAGSEQQQQQRRQVTQPAKLARLVSQGTAVLEAAQRELCARTAAKLETECATQ